MAINIRIGTAFDPKGLNQAQQALNKIQGNFRNLGRNFVIAGAAFAGATAVITKSAQALSRIESINAQTAQTIKSMGNAANVSAGQVEELANKLEAMTATEAESIQEGANLLLTFRNISDQFGEGNDIFTQTTEIMVDMARVLKSSTTQEAIRLGKALNDPVRGLTALTKVGVSFTDQQREQVKALQESGDLLGAQKIILAELNAQFGGSGAAYAATFAGQVDLLNHELGALGEEATLVVMPALQTMVGQFRELAPEIGAKMKTAIESVDWKAFAQTIVDLITFLTQNAETIMRVVTAIYLLNTAYNLGKVAVGLYSAATLIAKANLDATTTSAKLLRTALFLGGVTIAVGSVIEEYRRLKEVVSEANSEVSKFNQESIAVSGAAAKLNPINTLWQNITKSILGAITANRTFNNELGTPRATGGSVMDDYGYNLRSNTPVPQIKIPTVVSPVLTGGGKGTASSLPALSGLPALIAEANKNSTMTTKAAIRATKLGNAGLSKEVSAWIATSSKPAVAANQALARISKNGAKAITNLTNAYNKSSAGQAAAAQASAEASAAASQAAAEMQAAQEAAARAAQEAADREAAALAERERVYQSFLDTVKNTFAGIKNSILGAFDLTQLGGSTSSITRNMDKLLAKLRSFASNVRNLAGMGLDPALLQQVITAGPVAGARLASALVAGGAGALANINRGFAEFGDLAGQIATTGTESLFNRPTQQSVYNINVSGGVGSGATIGQAIVDAIKAYERTSGAVWVGA
jgi:hypothetical protein